MKTHILKKETKPTLKKMACILFSILFLGGNSLQASSEDLIDEMPELTLELETDQPDKADQSSSVQLDQNYEDLILGEDILIDIPEIIVEDPEEETERETETAEDKELIKTDMILDVLEEDFEETFSSETDKTETEAVTERQADIHEPTLMPEENAVSPEEEDILKDELTSEGEDQEKGFSEEAIPESEGETPLMEGDCGKIEGAVFWKIDKNGILIISGNGSMLDWADPQEVPWFEYADLIKSLDIGEDVQEIGSYAFSMCDKLKAIRIG